MPNKVYRNISPNGRLTTIYGVYEADAFIHNAHEVPPNDLQRWVNDKLIREEDSEDDDGLEEDLETRLARQKAEKKEEEIFSETDDNSKPNPGNPITPGKITKAVSNKPSKPNRR